MRFRDCLISRDGSGGRIILLLLFNSLFAGSDEGDENWACLASLIETCKLSGVKPQAYFADLLTRLVNSWPQKHIDELNRLR
jgi:transposase